MIYLQLFLSYLKIGFFGFGGGYAMLSLIQNEMVTRLGWMTATELADIVAVSQMTPGPIAFNCATYVGYTVTGNVWGSMLTTLAVSLPPLTLKVLITIFYTRLRDNRIMQGAMKWMKPMICGMIGAAALLFVNGTTFIDWKSYAIFLVCFLATWFRVDSILMICLSAVAGILLYI